MVRGVGLVGPCRDDVEATHIDVVERQAKDPLALVIRELHGGETVALDERVDVFDTRLPPGVEVTREDHGAGVLLEDRGRRLQPGDVVLLQGELGSGKTMLAQGIGQGLAVREPVKSSSFVLLNEYHGRLTLYHADLYRLEDPAQVAELALEEVAAPGALAVEWPERAWQVLPSARTRSHPR